MQLPRDWAARARRQKNLMAKETSVLHAQDYACLIVEIAIKRATEFSFAQRSICVMMVS